MFSEGVASHDAHGIGTKLASAWGQNMLYTKSYQVLCRKGMSILTGLRVSSLAFKCVFYRTEHSAKGGLKEVNSEVLEMKKWNIPKDRAQRVDEENGVICLVVMFIPGLMVSKILKMVHFFLFSADDSKQNNHSFGKTFKCIWKKMHLSAY